MHPTHRPHPSRRTPTNQAARPGVRRAALLAAASILFLLLGGCFTPEVLDDSADHSPAAAPNVELRLKTDAPADVLVLYDEYARKSSRLQRRAFYLFANQDRLTRGKTPVFVAPDSLTKFAPIPILHQRPADPAAPGEIYAVSTLPSTFEVTAKSGVLAEFRLPAYGNWLTAKKLFLFPLAAAGDAVGLGAVAGAMTLERMGREQRDNLKP